MQIVVNPLYAHLREFISEIPLHRYACDEILYNKRNVVEKVTAPNGMVLVIKKYARPTIANQWVYTFLRWSKPKRSYKFARRFDEYGLQTAERVAYIETSKCGIFHTGYYITRFVDQHTITQIDLCLPEERRGVLNDLASFMVELHSKGITHGDFNSGNIFYQLEGGHYRFTLIDINRMQFRRRVSKSTAVKEFKRLLNRQNMIEVAGQYAALRGWNADLFCGAILMDRGLALTHRLKKILHAIIYPFVKTETRARYRR